MANSSLLFLFCSFLLHFFTLTSAQQPLYAICQVDKGNFTANSPYHQNLNHLLSSLSNTEIRNGFYNASYGENKDKVNTMVLCRGDVKPDICKTCATNSAQQIIKLCPNQYEAFIWYDECMLRYSNRYFFGNLETGPYFSMYNVKSVTNTVQFNEKVDELLDDLKDKATSGDSVSKFAMGNATIPNGQTIYALVQCTPDLSDHKCSECLNNVTDLLPNCCSGKLGGRVISPSCHLRYETNLFYNETVPIMNSPAPSPSHTVSAPPEGTVSPSTQSANSSPGRGTGISNRIDVKLLVPLFFLMIILEN